VAQPITVVLEARPGRNNDLSIGWIPLAGTEPGGPIEPLVLRQEVPSGGAGKAYRFQHYLVPPLVEGDYELELKLDGGLVEFNDESVKQKLKVHFNWTAQARKARVLAVENDSVTFSPGDSDLKPPLRLGMRLFRLDENRYNQPFGFEAKGVWTGQPSVKLEPTSSDFSFPVPEGQRADLFLLDRSGREVPLRRNEGR
jgi:hypothetical protein